MKLFLLFIILTISSSFFSIKTYAICSSPNISIKDCIKEINLQLEAAKEDEKKTLATAICYSSFTDSKVKAHSIYLVPFTYSPDKSLDQICSTAINPSWGARGLAKTGHYSQPYCSDLKGPYTSFVPKDLYESTKKDYATTQYGLCNEKNAFICCSNEY